MIGRGHMRETGVIYRRVRRAPREIVEGFRQTAVASVHESLPRANLLDVGIRPLQTGARVVGTAVTAECIVSDNLAMHAALSLAEPGDVLVVSIQGSSLGAQWGGMAANQAVMQGLAGMVVDGGARDLEEMRRLGFPVWARAVSAWSTDKRGVIGVNVPICCGGVVVRPGDIIVADDDGVVVVPKGISAEVLERALARDRREAEILERIREGERLFDILGYAEVLKKAGVVEVDDIYEAHLEE